MHSGIVAFTWIVLLPLDFALHWALHMVYGADPRRRDDHLQIVLSMAGWLLIVAGVLGPLLAVSGVLSVLLIFVFFLLVIIAVERCRDAQRRALLWALAVAAERDLPLPEAARAFAADRVDEMGRRADRLADLLEAGVDLPDALRKSGNPLPIDAELAAQMSQETGRFTSSLRESLRDVGRSNPVWDLLWQRLAYFVALLVFGLFLTVFMLVKVVPTYKVVFEEFGVELPLITRLFINVAETLVLYRFLAAPLILLFALLVAYGIAYACGWLRWEPPGIAWLTRRYHGTVVLRSLAQAVDTDQPLDTTLELLARWYPRDHVRSRLRHVAAEVAAGNDWCLAFCRAGLIGAAEAAVLDSAQRVGNLAWALREMSESAARRMAYRGGVLLSLGIPAILLMIGVGVGVYAVAFFLPLSQLLLDLS